MIDLENLNDQEFEDIVESAKKQIQHLDSEWTNTQESDPGISLIELFAWLKVLQNRKINRSCSNSQQNFIELLDIKRKHNKGATALICVSGAERDALIPKNTRWAAGDIIFENEKEQNIISSVITDLEFINSDTPTKVIYKHMDGSRSFSIFGDIDANKRPKDNRMLKINFDKPIKKNMDFNLYFDIFSDKKRNPIGPNDDFIDMATLIWEYYGEKDGRLGWHLIKVEKDETYNFLFSGIISMKISSDMKEIGGVYSIRAHLLDDNYDFPPKVRHIKTNVFPVRQRLTICDTVVLKKKEMTQDNRFVVSTNLALYGETTVYVNKNSRWLPAYKFKIEKNIEAGKTAFNIEKMKSYIDELNPDDAAVMLISCDRSLGQGKVLGSGTGITEQKLPINHKRVDYDSFGIIVGEKYEGKMLFDEWNKVENFYSSKKDSLHYVLNLNKNLIEFGDHEYGQAPQAGINNIRLSGLSYTYGRESNIKRGLINKAISQSNTISNLKVEQITDAVGGRDTETKQDMLARASKYLNNDERAVTLSDYERIVKSTPGLILDNIKVIPNSLDKNDDGTQNCVTIVVKTNHNNKRGLLKSYERNIGLHINKHRLLNTKVDITGSIYVGLRITGDIIINSYYRDYKKMIEDNIYKFVDNLNQNLGQTLCFGELFGMIDRLDCVSYVDNIKVVPKGDYIDKSLTDDIIIPPHCGYYIEKLELNYINSSNI